MELWVVKGDGRHEPCDPQKLLLSLSKACKKRLVSLEAIVKTMEEIMPGL